METLDGHAPCGATLIGTSVGFCCPLNRLLLPHFAGFLSNNAYIHTKFMKAPYFKFYFRKHHLQNGTTESESLNTAVIEEILAPLLSTQKYIFTSQVRSYC